MRNIALIDIGSNTMRMIVAEREETDFKILLDMRASVRLAEGMGEGIASEPIERAVVSLERFCEKAKKFDAQPVAVATAALRIADNREHFFSRARLIGVPVVLLSGLEEAEIMFCGAMRHVGGGSGIIMDLGGGSMQLVGYKDGKRYEAHSFPLGSVRMAERFSLLGSTVDIGRIEELKNYASKALSEQEWIMEAGPLLLGVGGALRILSRLTREDGSYEDKPIPQKAMLMTFNKIYSSSHDERLGWTGMTPDRADILPASAAIVETVFERSGALHADVSFSGLREGLLSAWAERRWDPMTMRIPNII